MDELDMAQRTLVCSKRLYLVSPAESQQSYDRLSNNTLKDMTTPFFMNGPEY
jgi:hypothetical protein